ncbi:MAG TPA: hypothetical protein PLG04_03505 [Anaerolineaceae bacterium]|nr:hypothetical protein [Anaerolineaceae bacterium]
MSIEELCAEIIRIAQKVASMDDERLQRQFLRSIYFLTMNV